MGWRQREDVERIDGLRALLVLREGALLESSDFSEGRLDELVRAALVRIVSALDRYCHDLVLSRVVGELGRAERSINSELRRLGIPILSVRAAIRQARIRRGRGGRVRPRPMNIIRQAIQDVLHRETYQSADDIARGLRMIGVENVWQRCAAEMEDRAENVIRRLNGIVDRRNRIVHEGDFVRRRRGARPTLQAMSRGQVGDDVQWVATLVNAIHAIAG